MDPKTGSAPHPNQVAGIGNLQWGKKRLRNGHTVTEGVVSQWGKKKLRRGYIPKKEVGLEGQLLSLVSNVKATKVRPFAAVKTIKEWKNRQDLLLDYYEKFLNGQVELKEIMALIENASILLALGGGMSQEIRNASSESREATKAHLLRLKSEVEEGFNELQKILNVSDPIRDILVDITKEGATTTVKEAANRLLHLV